MLTGEPCVYACRQFAISKSARNARSKCYIRSRSSCVSYQRSRWQCTTRCAQNAGRIQSAAAHLRCPPPPHPSARTSPQVLGNGPTVRAQKHKDHHQRLQALNGDIQIAKGDADRHNLGVRSIEEMTPAEILEVASKTQDQSLASVNRMKQRINESKAVRETTGTG